MAVHTAAWRARLLTTPGADPWCSGPSWTLAANRAFALQGRPWVWSCDEGLWVLAGHSMPGGDVITSLESMWGFSCPFLGDRVEADLDRAAASFYGELAESPWMTVVLSGLPEDGELLRALQAAKPAGVLTDHAKGIVRQVADLTGGASAWLASRSRRFRRLLAQVEVLDLNFEDVSQDPDVLQRLLRIETRSWKGDVQTGMTSVSMARFYGDMIQSLQRRGELRAHVARRAGEDVGYILGASRGEIYRGFQLSYVESVKDLQVGHALQWHEIRSLAARGVTRYDMGMDKSYKRRWASRTEGGWILVLHRDPDVPVRLPWGVQVLSF